MNREVKFRAWHRELKVMLNVYIISQRMHVGEEYYSECRGWYGDNIQVQFRYDEVDWMQSTGLTDKNNTKIYEGDVVEYSSEIKVNIETCKEVNSPSWKIGVVEFIQGEYKIKITRQHNLYFGELPYYESVFWFDKMTVIGNIYEHPELLNEI